MSKRPKRVLVLYDLPEMEADHADPRYLLDHEDRPTEKDVCRALKKLGLELYVHGIFDETHQLWQRLQEIKPDVVFNLCETFRGDRSHEGDIASILELANVPYTGATPAALHLCKDKGATKKIVAWDGVRVPAFMVYSKDAFKFEPFDAIFPLIVKPLNREASEGIAKASIVESWDACRERASWVVQKLQSDVIVEEYIHGRELYVAILEVGGHIKAMPPRELFFHKIDKSEPMIATYKAKWDQGYRKRWGISTGRAAPLPESLVKTLKDTSIYVFRTLGLSGYARMDWRLSENGDAVFLEANPNPALSQDDDFALAVKASGISYGELIAQILASAVAAENLKSVASKS
jgi:D-alanine-D-alanine ligase